jgi:hypothetical protein
MTLLEQSITNITGTLTLGSSNWFDKITSHVPNTEALRYTGTETFRGTILITVCLKSKEATNDGSMSVALNVFDSSGSPYYQETSLMRNTLPSIASGGAYNYTTATTTRTHTFSNGDYVQPAIRASTASGAVVEISSVQVNVF